MGIQYKYGISIIIPVHNNEKTLDRCIISILKQTYKKFEIIIIDDGSSDLSSEICKKYLEYDKRIKYFYKKNGGVCSARNLGLMKVEYIYITFIDADDFIDEQYLENFIKYAKDFDWVIQGMRYLNSRNEDISFLLDEKLNTKRSIIAKNINTINNEILNIPALGWITNKLYKTEIIKKYNIHFSEVPIINGDRAFNLLYALCIRSFIALSAITYNYIENFNSLSHKYVDPYLFMMAAKVYDSILNKNIIYNKLYDYIIKYSTRFYIRAIGECIISRSNKIKLNRKIYVIIFSIIYLLKSNMLRKKCLKTCFYIAKAIYYYKIKYSLLNKTKNIVQ